MISRNFLNLNSYSREWWSYISDGGHYQGLDLLRALAIMAVIWWHFSNTDLRFGWIGVNLFFILSGFLIGSILLKSFERGNFSYGRYLWDRFLRIYPLYCVAVIGYIFSRSVRGGGEFDLALIAGLHAGFLQTVAFDLWGLNLPYYMVTWSLVVEILFYVTIPPILIGLLKLRMVWPGLIAVVAGFVVLRFLIISDLNPDDPNWHFYYFLRPYFRYDELLYGVLVSYAVYQGYSRLKWLSLLGGLLGLVCVCIYISNIPGADSLPSMALLTWEVAVFPTVLAIVFSLIVYSIYNKPWSCWPVNAVARLAFPLYLIHESVNSFHFDWFSYLAISLALSVVASYCIEYPFIRVYKARRARSPVVVQHA